MTRLICHNVSRNAVTSVRVRTLLSPGDPFSVVFPLNASSEIQVARDLIDHRYALSWCGVPCGLVRLWIGLPIAGTDTPRSFRLLALLPIHEIEDVPPFIRLGAEFLHAKRASVQLSSSPCEGRLVIPYP
jgi:hypothetical protein